MTREEAIVLLECSATEAVGVLAATTEPSAAKQLQRYIDAYDMAIAALREQEEYEIQRHLKHFDIKKPRPEPVTKCNDLYDEDGGEILNQDVPDTKVMKTNADHIRSMTDEELVEFVYACDLGFLPWCDKHCECKGDEGCDKCISSWFKQPYKEDVND